MAYALKDVDDAEALIRELRPDAKIWRDSYGWSLTIGDGYNHGLVIFIFRPRCDDLGEKEITSTKEEIRDICFLMGSQWTADEVLKLTSQMSRRRAPINRIQ